MFNLKLSSLRKETFKKLKTIKRFVFDTRLWHNALRKSVKPMSFFCLTVYFCVHGVNGTKQWGVKRPQLPFMEEKTNKNELNWFILMQKSANCVDMPLLWKPNRKFWKFWKHLEHRRVQVKVKVVDKKLLKEAFMLHTSSRESWTQTLNVWSSARRPVKTALNIFTPVNK